MDRAPRTPALVAARFPWYLRIVGGRRPARSIHVLCLCGFLAIFVVHVCVVIAHGAIHEMALIVFGDLHHVSGALGLAVGLAGVAGIMVMHVVATRYSLRHPRRVQRRTQALTDPLRRALFERGRSVQQYAITEIPPHCRVNGRPPAESTYAAMAHEHFASFVLDVDGLLEQPLHLTLAELRRWPKQTQVTKHCCIQGWSAVASWGGVSLGDIIRRCRPLTSARFLVFYAFDDKATAELDAAGTGCYYGTINIALALHPQTILAYEMNGGALPSPHGAPLRLRVETQLGFTMVKYIRRIAFVQDYSHIGAGHGGWREDHQYYGQEAGI